jgi:outer membrane protein assembly factor BamE (lipoprotein component of BamABCDE complex)
MKYLKIIPQTVLLSLAFMAFQAYADELVVPVGQQGAEKASIARPTSGMKQAKVEEKFGAPNKRTDSVGKPPISSWEYPDYTVYFENDRVIHSVLKPTADADTAAPATPAPATDASKTQ